MQDIDFLPVEYRQKHAQQQSQPWQIVASVAILALVAAAGVTQNHRRRAMQDDLAIIGPAYDAAVNQQNRLAEIQSRLKVAKAGAELVTYLRHPWPRSQLVAALVAPLPPEITIQQVQIVRQVSPTPAPTAMQSPVGIQTPVDKKTEEETRKSLPPAERDLMRLRAQLDPMQTVVILTGTATESAILHRYIGELDATDIFDKAELDCFNSVDSNKGSTAVQFRAVLLVQPGYGQPGGPTGPDKNYVAQGNTKQP
jgi:hypothetical protein